MYALLNPISLLLGLAAWALPLCFCSRMERHAHRFGWFLGGSGLACALALFLQLLYVGHLVRIEDWAALLDTTDAVAHAAAVLVSVAAMLNLSAILLYRGWERRTTHP